MHASTFLGLEGAILPEITPFESRLSPIGTFFFFSVSVQFSRYLVVFVFCACVWFVLVATKSRRCFWLFSSGIQGVVAFLCEDWVYYLRAVEDCEFV